MPASIDYGRSPNLQIAALVARTCCRAGPSSECAKRYTSSVAQYRRYVRATFEAAAISELARRTLRSTHVIYEANGNQAVDVGTIATSITDASPSMMISFELIEHNENRLRVILSDSAGGEIGGTEPTTMSNVWIPGDISENWNRYLAVMFELAVAGYPGCIGCAGPAAEIPWDEAASRRRLA